MENEICQLLNLSNILAFALTIVTSLKLWADNDKDCDDCRLKWCDHLKRVRDTKIRTRLHCTL
jgi:hypothetical protein